MSELTIYEKIEEIVEKIKNKEDIQDVISDINEISKNLYELPLYHEFIEMMALFNKIYDTCLLAGEKEAISLFIYNLLFRW